MKRISLLMALGALTLAFGCDNGNGEPDGGGIHLVDSGHTTTPDSGHTTTPDSGTTPTGCSVAGATGFPALPAACLPRCATATGQAVNDCATSRPDSGGADAGTGSVGECQVEAVMADTSATTTIDLGGGMTDTLNCYGCWTWQLNSCIFDSCMTQLAACNSCAADQCDTTTAGCETEEGALNTCINTNLSAIQSCFGTRASMCFGNVSGFSPGVQAPEVHAMFDRFVGFSMLPASFR